MLMHLKSHDTGKSCGDTITLPTIGFLCHFSDLLVVKRLDTDQATDGYSRLRVIASPRLALSWHYPKCSRKKGKYGAVITCKA